MISGRDNHTNFSVTTDTNLYNCVIAEMDVLRRPARKSRMERRKNEQIKEIIGVKGKPNWSEREAGYNRHNREGKTEMLWPRQNGARGENIQKLIVEWIPRERRKRGRQGKTRMEGVQAAVTTRNLEPDQWRNREEWRLVSGRQRELLKIPDR